MEKSSDTKHLQCDDELFTKFKLFAELSHDELKTLLEHSACVAYSAGQRIVSAGEAGHCMYVILKGKVRVSSKNGAEDVELALLGPTNFFGEVALVDDGPRSADVTAVEDCELLSITRMTLGILAGLQPGAAVHLLASIGRSLVARLRQGNQKYMDLIVLTGQRS